jgi:hypothetical protein
MADSSSQLPNAPGIIALFELPPVRHSRFANPSTRALTVADNDKLGLDGARQVGAEIKLPSPSMFSGRGISPHFPAW